MLKYLDKNDVKRSSVLFMLLLLSNVLIPLSDALIVKIFVGLVMILLLINAILIIRKVILGVRRNKNKNGF